MEPIVERTDQQKLAKGLAELPKLVAALTNQMAKGIRDWSKLRAIAYPMCSESQIVRLLLEKQLRPDLSQCLAAADAMDKFVATGKPLLSEVPKEHEILNTYFENIGDRGLVLRRLVEDCKELDTEFGFRVKQPGQPPRKSHVAKG